MIDNKYISITYCRKCKYGHIILAVIKLVNCYTLNSSTGIFQLTKVSVKERVEGE